MGHRIKLAENIIKALKRMKCPYPLEAHQIQGMTKAKINKNKSIKKIK